MFLNFSREFDSVSYLEAFRKRLFLCGLIALYMQDIVKHEGTKYWRFAAMAVSRSYSQMVKAGCAEAMALALDDAPREGAPARAKQQPRHKALSAWELYARDAIGDWQAEGGSGQSLCFTRMGRAALRDGWDALSDAQRDEYQLRSRVSERTPRLLNDSAGPPAALRDAHSNALALQPEPADRRSRSQNLWAPPANDIVMRAGRGLQFEEYKAVVEGDRGPLSVDEYTAWRNEERLPKKTKQTRFKRRASSSSFDDGSIPDKVLYRRLCGPVCLQSENRQYLRVRSGALEVLKGLVRQTVRSCCISPLCIAQCEVLLFFDLMIESHKEDDAAITQEHHLMMIAEIIVANHQSGPNQASQVFLEYEVEVPTELQTCRVGPDAALSFDGVLIRPKRHPFVQSNRSAALPAGLLHPLGVGALVQHVEVEAVAEVLKPLQGENPRSAVLTIGKLLHQDFPSEREHDLNILRGLDPAWGPCRAPCTREEAEGEDEEDEDFASVGKPCRSATKDVLRPQLDHELLELMRKEDEASSQDDGSDATSEGVEEHNDNEVGGAADPDLDDGEEFFGAGFYEADGEVIEEPWTIDGAIARAGFEHRNGSDYLYMSGSALDSVPVGRLQTIHGLTLSLKIYCLCSAHRPIEGKPQK